MKLRLPVATFSLVLFLNTWFLNASFASDLPSPYETKSVRHYSKVIGWPEGKTPVAPAGFTVTAFANKNLINPRNLYIAPNGDVFVSEANTEITGLKKVGADLIGASGSQRLEKSANRITLLRADAYGKVILQSVFLENLNRPYGMLITQGYFYVANMDGLWRYPYQTGQTAMDKKGEKILDLPTGGYNNHWTRNLILSPDGKKIFVSVGSGSNAGEHGPANEIRRANILEINLDGSSEIIYASGMRNPVGMSFVPGTSDLWTVVNERDELGDELVPDYFTQVKKGAFYGWPYSYFGQNLDPRIKGKDQRPDLVKAAIVPDFPLGSHTASLGLTFYDGKAFPDHYQGGAFIGQHGSWNRSVLAGYEVAYLPFKNGKPTGQTENFLTGFIENLKESRVYGRPVAVTVTKDGSLLVADDAGNTIWRVSSLKH